MVQGFEKMISGMYLGDIVRRVILRMSQEADILGDVPSQLSMPFSLRFSLSPFLLSLALSSIHNSTCRHKGTCICVVDT